MTQIRVNIDQKNSLITVYNNGRSIPIELHKEHKVYVPELVFGKDSRRNVYFYRSSLDFK